MTVERAVWRWKTAGGALLLVATGLLTRVACAPPPAARGPAAPGGEAGPEQAAGAAGGAGPAASVPASPAVELPTPTARGTAEPGWAGGGASDTPFAAAGASAAPAPADVDAPVVVDAPAVAAPAGSVPPMQRQELALLASIERDLEREPPPEVHALLDEYRRGADRSTLVARVQRDFPNDLRLRVTVLRWIDQVRPDSGRASAAPPVPGQGGGTPWVRPLERR